MTAGDPGDTGTTRSEAPDAGPPRQGLLAEVRDAVTPRTLALGAGVLVLQLLFIWSYVGAFHAPALHRVPVVVAAPAPVAAQVAAGLNGIAGQPVHATAVPDQASAAARVRGGDSAAALIVRPAGRSDTLLVASGGGAALADALTLLFTRADATRQRTVTVHDIVPLQPGDARGLTGFYLVVGWIVGGYLLAALLGVSAGRRPTTRRAIIRLLAMVPYAVLSGLGGTLIVDQGLGALTGHFWALWGIGALLVYAVAAVTMAFQVVAGIVGIGLAVLVFVIAGNPSASGAYQTALLPPFWRAISYALPTGAATDAVRRIVYFGGNGITIHLLVISAWLIAGVTVAMIGSLRNDRGRPAALGNHRGLAGPRAASAPTRPGACGSRGSRGRRGGAGARRSG